MHTPPTRRGIRLNEALEDIHTFEEHPHREEPPLPSSGETDTSHHEDEVREVIHHETAKLSWQFVAWASGIILALASAWVTAVSTVTWQLARNDDVVQSRLSALESDLSTCQGDVNTLYRTLSSFPDTEQRNRAQTIISQYPAMIANHEKHMDECRRSADGLRKDLSDLRGEVSNLQGAKSTEENFPQNRWR